MCHWPNSTRELHMLRSFDSISTSYIMVDKAYAGVLTDRGAKLRAIDSFCLILFSYCFIVFIFPSVLLKDVWEFYGISSSNCVTCYLYRCHAWQVIRNKTEDEQSR